MEKTIDQQATYWNNKVLLSSFAVLILGTNAFNAYIHQQEINTNGIAYEKERSDKKDERVLADAKHYVEMNNLKVEIVRLDRELKQCKE
jgi:hypothetical protein